MTVLAESSQRVPLVHAALGAYFQLESLTPDDEPRLEKAAEALHDWFGPRLKWAWCSYAADIEDDIKEALGAMSGQCRIVHEPPVLPGDKDADFSFAYLRTSPRHDFFVRLSGGQRPVDGSPWSARFWCELIGLRLAPHLLTRPVLQLTVPLDHDLGEFQRRVLEIGSMLNVRWGNAGFTYATWEFLDSAATRRAVFRHSRRHYGYDAGNHVRMCFENLVRSINWMTFLGAPLWSKVSPTFQPRDPGVRVYQAGELVVVQAGPRPASCDINRLDVSPTYREVDRLLMAIRARDVDLFFPWSVTESARWLTRFERIPF